MEVLIGKTTIYRYDGQYGTTYSVGLRKKKKDGTYEMGFMPVRFKKDVEVENKTEISVPKDMAWLSFNVKDGKTYPFIFINDFEVVEKEPSKEEVKEEPKDDNMKIYEDFGKEIEIKDEDLPF